MGGADRAAPTAVLTVLPQPQGTTPESRRRIREYTGYPKNGTKERRGEFAIFMDQQVWSPSARERKQVGQHWRRECFPEHTRKMNSACPPGDA